MDWCHSRVSSFSTKSNSARDANNIRLMNFLSTTDDFLHYLKICRPKLVAIDPSLHDTIDKALISLPLLRQVNVISLLGSDTGAVNVSLSIAAAPTPGLRTCSTHTILLAAKHCPS